MVKKNECQRRGHGHVVRAMLLAGLLSACAAPTGGWHHPAKNESLTKGDFAACQLRAEESTLELRRADRSGYGVLDTGGPGPFNPRGDDTMAIAERSDTSTLYNVLVDRCMTQKGYSPVGTRQSQ